MKFNIILFIMLLIFNISVAQEYIPTSTGEIIRHTYYTLSYSELHEQAEWVYYKLTPDMLNGKTKRTNYFKKDPKVSTGSASSSDYTKSGFDRGHLCPAGSMTCNKTAMSESFYMSNVSPQYPSFNRGVWKRLEEQVREWASTDSVLYIVTGAVLTDSLGVIGKNKVTIPRYFYKIIYSPKQKTIKSYLLPNIGHPTITQARHKNINQYQTTLTEIKSLTYLNYFF